MTPLERDQEIQRVIDEDRYYPERLALYLWDWGEGELEGIEEPDTWQMEDLRALGEDMRARRAEFEATGTAPKILDIVASGRGIGKSAEIGMIAVVLLSAWPDAKISVLANTGPQLSTKTWPAIQTWLRRSRIAHWFESNTSIIYRHGARDSWFCSPITWDLGNTQASAGQHNLGSANVFLFDEMSKIPNKIIEVALAGLLTGMAIAVGRGNATEPDGVFADALNKKRPSAAHPSPFGVWRARSIDSRTCRFPNKTEIKEAIEHYGEDSDYVRVWVRGLPPRGNISGYFPEALISGAMKARPRGLATDALIAMVDFAWGGDDNNMVRFREGLDFWSMPRIVVPGHETERPERMVHVLAEVMTKDYLCSSGTRKRVTMLFGDGSGICNEVFKGLFALGIKNFMAVNWAGVAADPRVNKNTKAQMIAAFKKLLEDGAGLDDCEELAADMREIMAVNFLPLQFEKKELMKKRLGRSTDDFDACVMSTYMPVILAPSKRKRRSDAVVTAWS